MPVNLSVLIVNYFAENLLTGLITSVNGFLSKCSSEIIIWDNGSRNGRPQTLSAPCTLTWFSSPDNVGFANGHNTLARRAEGKRFLIINPDAEFALGGLEQLWEAAKENPRAGVVAPRIQYPDGRLQVSVFPPYTFSFDVRKSFWLERTTIFSRLEREMVKKLAEAKGPFRVGWASGACLLVSREAWEKTGGFDPNFFFGGEDADFCGRVQEAGFEILCEPRSVLVHQAGQSLERELKMKVLYYYQKRLHYAHKHFSHVQYGILWLTSTLELVGKLVLGFFLSFFSNAWREKRKGYVGALVLIFSGRWKKPEGVMQKKARKIQNPMEAVV